MAEVVDEPIVVQYTRPQAYFEGPVVPVYECAMPVVERLPVGGRVLRECLFNCVHVDSFCKG